MKEQVLEIKHIAVLRSPLEAVEIAYRFTFCLCSKKKRGSYWRNVISLEGLKPLLS